jgi:Leucine-rich repeat (LRR) protein
VVACKIFLGAATMPTERKISQWEIQKVRPSTQSEYIHPRVFVDKVDRITLRAVCKRLSRNKRLEVHDELKAALGYVRTHQFIAHQGQLLDWAQEPLVKLAMHFDNLEDLLDEYEDIDFVHNTSRSRFVEKTITDELVNSQALMECFVDNKQLKSGRALQNLTCIETIAFWCDFLPYDDPEGKGLPRLVLEKELIKLMTTGMLIEFPMWLTITTAEKVARMMVEQMDGVITKQKTGSITTEEVNAWLGGRTLSEGIEADLMLVNRDYCALRLMYNATGGDHWHQNEWWNEGEELWRYYALEMRHMPGSGNELPADHVVTIDLSNNGLTGQIPECIGAFDHLEFLYLQNNQLTGSIPTSIGKLTRLKRLALSHNALTGSIPGEVGNIVALECLYLQCNQLTGPIPEEIGHCHALHTVILSSNQLSGEIPDAMHDCEHLKFVCLNNNQLTGTLPASLSTCARTLISIEMHTNLLSGEIPSEWCAKLNLLQTLDLSNNQLTGPIPEKLGDLKELRDLRLNENQLSGSIPASVGRLTHLESIAVYINQLTGVIPNSLGKCVNLREVALWSNDLTGPVPKSLANPKLKFLESIHVQNNRIDDPEEAWKMLNDKHEGRVQVFV